MRTPLNFTIHGLWPDNNGQRLLNCNSKGHRFKAFKDGRFVAKLDYRWPDLFEASPGTKQTFWRDEWAKHGTCSNLNQQQYFTKAIELKDRFNLLHILEASGINYGLKVDPRKVNASVSAATGHLPILKCVQKLLSEIIICFDSNGANVIDCPPPFSTPCGNKMDTDDPIYLMVGDFVEIQHLKGSVADIEDEAPIVAIAILDSG
ncbi:Ribonuclease S-2 [Sesamum alatum]|uniref:Ribonuclease S-2 n=1 Tax=Sesamum alatum TaxID=300844 RepID=A0AAE2CVA8_9LAMI|nr:Ribonuclease S-2 [Sesamum alatum]